MPRPQLLDNLHANPHLPSLPAVAFEVLELTRNEAVNLKEVARVIQNDQALAAKVLRTVNSSYYGLNKRCGSIHSALVYLGLNTVKTIVLGFSLVDSLDGGGEHDVAFNFLQYWQRCLTAAAAARDIATRVGGVDPEEAFLSALMQDIGMVWLYRHLGDQYLQCMDLADDDHMKLPDQELMAFDVTHQMVGAEVSRRWRFPRNMIAAIEHHHDHSRAAPDDRGMAMVVELANAAAAALGQPGDAAQCRLFVTRAADWCSLTHAQAESILESLGGAVGELADLFNLGRIDLADPAALMDEADQQLADHQAQVRQDREDRPEEPGDLIDPNTALPNAATMSRFLAEEIADARDADGSIALILIEVDHLASIAEQSGAPEAFRIVRTVAAHLETLLPGAAQLAHPANTTLAVIIRTDREHATRLAETIRTGVLDLGLHPRADEHRRVTASIGVAAVDGSLLTQLRGPHTLVRIADEALNAARSAGRNCVRVFRPRTADAA